AAQKLPFANHLALGKLCRRSFLRFNNRSLKVAHFVLEDGFRFEQEACLIVRGVFLIHRILVAATFVDKRLFVPIYLSGSYIVLSIDIFSQVCATLRERLLLCIHFPANRRCDRVFALEAEPREKDRKPFGIIAFSELPEFIEFV